MQKGDSSVDLGKEETLLMCSQEELQTPKVERQVHLSNNAAATAHSFQMHTASLSAQSSECDSLKCMESRVLCLTYLEVISDHFSKRVQLHQVANSRNDIIMQKLQNASSC